MTWQTSWYVTSSNTNCSLLSNKGVQFLNYEIPFDMVLHSVTICSKVNFILGIIKFHIRSLTSDLLSTDVQIAQNITTVSTNLKLQAGTIIQLSCTSNLPIGSIIILHGKPSIPTINYNSYWQPYLKHTDIIYQITGNSMGIIYSPIYSKTKLTHVSISCNDKNVEDIILTIGTGKTIMANLNKNEGLKKFVIANNSAVDKDMDILYNIDILFDKPPHKQTKRVDISSRNIIVEQGQCIYIQNVAWFHDTTTKRGVFHVHIIGMSA